MSALDNAAVLMEYGNIEVGDDAGTLVDLGAVRNVRFTGRLEKTKVESDNRGTILNRARLIGNVDVELLEPGNAATLENLFKGLVARSAVAGSIVNDHQQVVASGAWLFDKFIEFTFQNANGTCPNIDSVAGSTDGALVLNTDYFKVKDAGTGKWGIVILDSVKVTTETQTITVQYDYTPAAAQVLTGGSAQTATPRYVKITGPSEDNASITREIVLDGAVAASDLLLAFVNVENSGDVGVMPVTLEGNKGSTWTLTDEINPS